MLTDAQRNEYAAKGYTWPIPVLSADEAAHYRERFEAYERRHGVWYELSKDQKLYLLQNWVAELVADKRVIESVADVLGEDVFCWGSSLFVKEAQSTSYVSWHQDSTYWGLSSADVVTAWIALSPATLESGCMKMVPGGAEREQLPHSDTLASENLLTRGREIQVEVDDAKPNSPNWRPARCRCTTFAPSTRPNPTTRTTVTSSPSVTSRHTSSKSMRRTTAHGWRGVDRYHHFIHETPPKADMDDAALAEHKRIMRLRQGVLYRGVDGGRARVRPMFGRGSAVRCQPLVR